MKKLLLLSTLIICVFVVNAQKNIKTSRKELKAEKKAQQMNELKALIESEAFIFDARTANPMSGSNINLTTDYDVRVTNDSLFSYLPYYGVSHSAVYGGTESPMIFSQPIDSKKTEKTKNGYFVKISVKNGSDRLDFSFHISVTGSATLIVSSINRQSISYYGEIVKKKGKQE